MSKIKNISVILLFLLSAFIVQKNTIAQSCPEEELHRGEEASKITRRVKLPKFGIEISVPENYRVMLIDNENVQILHPQDYAYIQCTIEGRGYARGMSVISIKLISRNPQLSLKEQIEKNSEGYSSPEKIYPYSEGILSGYILVHHDQQTEFIADHPSLKNKLISINDFCDCPIEETDLLEFLSTLAVSILP